MAFWVRSDRDENSPHCWLYRDADLALKHTENVLCIQYKRVAFSLLLWNGKQQEVIIASKFFCHETFLKFLNIYMIINIGSVIQNIHCHKPVYPCEQRFAKKHVLIFYLWLKLLFLTTNTNITACIKLPSKEIVVGLSIELYLLLGCLLALNTWMSIGE